MEKAICQYALDRVMLYLRNYGVEPSPEVCRRALTLIDECLRDADSAACDGPGAMPGGVLAMVFDRLPEVFSLPDLDLPVQRPPIRRGSIGYGPPV
ncbi:hypothetical protein [Marinobacter sp. OP 3.4]|uniref:hypothetical protein n=1 Tax=Marinobacter sp. OP 3.4 TaxID=3076501 RepID=UPI002E2303AA